MRPARYFSIIQLSNARINDICNIGRAKITSRKEADFLRAESLKNDVDIFRRYYAL